MYVLDERGGWIYAKETTTDYFEPRYIIHWWSTGIRWYQFMQWFGTTELARTAIGGQVHPMSNVSYQDERGWTYRLTNGGQTKPEYTELVPILEPKQKGKKLELRWYQGYWQKYTARSGWIAA